MTKGLEGYTILKNWHPDSGKAAEAVGHRDALEEVQEFCSRPESSVHEGPTKAWYFYGYTDTEHYPGSWEMLTGGGI